MPKPKLNQIVAIEKGVKSRVHAELTADHHVLQKDELFRGHAKTYRPRDEDPTQPTGETLPDDNKKVIHRAEDIVRETVRKMSELFDVTATKDWGNCVAKADVVVGGQVILAQVPVTYLLFLEKQLTDLHTFVKKLPTLDPSENWEYSKDQDLYATRPVQTVRTKKITRPLVLYEATKEHPAQVKEVTEDVLAGTWSTIKYAGALSAQRVNELLRRIDELQKAIKFARETANGLEVDEIKVGEKVLSFVFS
ncbi:hypothetical protein LZC95_51085 [Pendulispora brunnea]|uniref:Uncharacterized protein n=1 Tax=Pendulispora brunnea TaxID=2905690 RepID=A0ABZ2K7X9_9BACT